MLSTGIFDSRAATFRFLRYLRDLNDLGRDGDLAKRSYSLVFQLLSSGIGWDDEDPETKESLLLLMASTRASLIPAIGIFGGGSGSKLGPRDTTPVMEAAKRCIIDNVRSIVGGFPLFNFEAVTKKNGKGKTAEDLAKETLAALKAEPREPFDTGLEERISECQSTIDFLHEVSAYPAAKNAP